MGSIAPIRNANASSSNVVSQGSPKDTAPQTRRSGAGETARVPPPGYSGESSFTPAAKAPTSGAQTDFATRKAQFALPIDASTPEKYDGMYLGSDGYAYPPDKFKASEVPPFTPSTGPSSKTSYYVNGIMTWPKGNGPMGDRTGIQADSEAQKIADKTGTNVVLVYNATSGNVAGDMLQTEGDRLGTGEDKANATLADALYSDLKAGKDVNVVGYSQGGAIVGRALRDVNERLKNDQGFYWPWEEGQKQAEREAQLGHVNATLFAGAGADFPDGPKYNFYVNREDPVPNMLGVHDANLPYDGSRAGLDALLGIPGVLLDGAHHDGKGARIHTFDEPGRPGADLFSADGVHGLDGYLQRYDP